MKWSDEQVGMQMRRIGRHGSVMETLLVSATLSVTQGCPVSADVYDADAVTFTFGADGEPAEVTFDAESLRTVLELGGRTLARMEAWQDEDSTTGRPVRLTTTAP